jgi:hypothetical protein
MRGRHARTGGVLATMHLGLAAASAGPGRHLETRCTERTKTDRRSEQLRRDALKRMQRQQAVIAKPYPEVRRDRELLLDPHQRDRIWSW